MPIDLKQSLLSGYHSIAGDYTAFSEREKSFPRENAQAACECCAARTWRVRENDEAHPMSGTRRERRMPGGTLPTIVAQTLDLRCPDPGASARPTRHGATAIKPGSRSMDRRGACG
jgi:hypothetical protein